MTTIATPLSASRSERAPAAGRTERAQLLAVQVLRAFAALAVVVFHAEYDAEVIAARAGLVLEHSELLPWMAGVDVFFVISGFVLYRPWVAARPYWRRGLARCSSSARRAIS